jgi:membrane protein required for colicin V production
VSLAIVDWLIIAVIGVSTLISLKRGFVKEALSLVTLVASVVIARMFGSQVATLLVDYISVPSVRLVSAYGLLFVATMIVGGMINFLISQIVEMTGLSGTDRFLGTLFGFARGAVIIVVAVAVLMRMPVKEDQWWQESMLIPHFITAADSIQEMIFGEDTENSEAAETS